MTNPMQAVYDQAVMQYALDLFKQDQGKNWSDQPQEIKDVYLGLAHLKVREELAKGGIV